MNERATSRASEPSKESARPGPTANRGSRPSAPGAAAPGGGVCARELGRRSSHSNRGCAARPVAAPRGPSLAHGPGRVRNAHNNRSGPLHTVPIGTARGAGRQPPQRPPAPSTSSTHRAARDRDGGHGPAPPAIVRDCARLAGAAIIITIVIAIVVPGDDDHHHYRDRRCDADEIATGTGAGSAGECTRDGFLFFPARQTQLASCLPSFAQFICVLCPVCVRPCVSGCARPRHSVRDGQDGCRAGRAIDRSACWPSMKSFTSSMRRAPPTAHHYHYHHDYHHTYPPHH